MTHGARLRMLAPITTPTIPQEPGTQGIENELSLRLSGISRPHPRRRQPPTRTDRRLAPPTLPGRPWPSQGLGMGTTHPPTMSTTLLLLFSKTRYPSLPQEGTESRQSHSDSGLTSPIPVIAPTSPIGAESDDEGPTPWALRSRNPFLASIIAAQQTPSMWRDPTMSGTHSSRLTETSSAPNESKHGNFEGQTSRPGQTGNTEAVERTWTTSSRPTEEPYSTSDIPPTGSSWQESMPTKIGKYSAPIPVNDAQTYGHEQRRNTDSSANSSSALPSDLMNASIRRTTFDDFQYDWESVFPGYNPEDANWEDPQPLADSPLNPRRPGYYTGPTTSRLIAGAGAGQDDMGDVADPWGDNTPEQPPVPPGNPPQDRTDQLIQQVALLRDENLHLQNDVADLRQCVAQRGRPGAPAYHPDPDHYSIP